ncbi:MAG: hypothetical protein Q4D55_02545 [Eubacteriales bacterium]|nr:hypothetical protein [Eubacteriales bacterium]
MKRFTKIMLVVTGILLILGVGFAASGAAMGGLFTSWEAVRTAGGLYPGKSIGDFGDWDEEDEEWEEAEVHHHDTQGQGGVGPVSAEGDARFWEFDVPQELEAELSCDELVMEPYEGAALKIQVEKDPDGLVTVRKKGNAVRVSSRSKKHKAKMIHIYYPQGTSFHELDLTIMAGEASLEGEIAAREAEISVGAGTLALKDSLTAEELDITVGMGEASFARIDAKKIQGECGVGSLSLGAAGNEEDYDYDIQCGVGSIEIGGQEIGGIASEKSIDNHGERKIDLECGMGEIRVDFCG